MSCLGLRRIKPHSWAVSMVSVGALTAVRIARSLRCLSEAAVLNPRPLLSQRCVLHDS